MTLDNEALFYNRHVFFCTNERAPGHERGCCAEKDSVKLRNYMKARLKELKIKDMRINTAGCLDRCELGPVVVIYPEGVWYRCASQQDADEIIQKHLIGGQKVERLQLPNR